MVTDKQIRRERKSQQVSTLRKRFSFLEHQPMDIIISYAQTMPHQSQASSFSNKGILLTIDEGTFGNNRTRNSMSWFVSE